MIWLRKILERGLDTILLAGAVVLAGSSSNGILLRLLIYFCIMMSLVELLLAYSTSYKRKMQKVFPAVAAFEFIALLSAGIAAIIGPFTGTELTIVVLATVITDACGLFFGKASQFCRLGRKVGALKYISPNKSYFGYLGELIGGYSGFYLLMNLFAICWNTQMLSVCIALPFTGAMGDLLGSCTKRTFGIKDSSETLSDQPVFRLIERFARSRNGYLDFMDSISFNCILLTIASLVL